MELLALANAHEHANTTQAFAAVVQHIARGKRAVIDRHRVSPFHLLHVADATQTFFKVTCWGLTLPQLTVDAAPANGFVLDTGANSALEMEQLALQVGDIVLFTGMLLKTFRGHVEAQFGRQSRAQLLYRRDRYFSTGNVRLKDLFPMIEWYKLHRHELLLGAKEIASQALLQDMMDDDGGDEEEETKVPVVTTKVLDNREQKQPTPGIQAQTARLTRFRDIREDTLAHVQCAHVRKCSELSDEQHNSNAWMLLRRPGGSLDIEGGTVLHEVVLEDIHGDTVGLNLWDQFADAQFVRRLLSFRGRAIEIQNVIARMHVRTQRLHVNTTLETEFRFIQPAEEHSNATNSRNDVHVTTASVMCDSIESMEQVAAGSTSTIMVLENVQVESVYLDQFLGHQCKVLPKYTPYLVEKFCSECQQALPVIKNDAIVHEYKTCLNGCMTSASVWRYKPMRMQLCDSHQGRLNVVARDVAVQNLVGNIEASMLITQSTQHTAGFNARFAVARMLNALGNPNAPLLFGAEIERQIKNEVSKSQRRESLNDSRDSLAEPAVVYLLRSLRSQPILNTL